MNNNRTRTIPQIPEGATVILAWSDPDQDRYGDEYLAHYVAFADDDLEPVGQIWTCSSRGEAMYFAAEIFSARPGLADFINETMW